MYGLRLWCFVARGPGHRESQRQDDEYCNESGRHLFRIIMHNATVEASGRVSNVCGGGGPVQANRYSATTF